MRPVRPKERYEEIDVLRGLAALTVVFSHYNPHWERFLGNIPVFIPNSYGYNAVLLFFVISGFVIFMTLEKCESVLDFAVLRVSRLYPAYWATLMFATFVTTLAFGQAFWAGGFVVNLTMFQEFLGYPNFDDVYWSLTVELAFYLNVAWLFAFRLHRFRQSLVVIWLAASCVWALTMHDPATEKRDLLALLLALDFAPYFAIGIVLFDSVRQGWTARRVALIAFAVVTEFLIEAWTGAGLALFAAAVVTLAVARRLPFLVTPVTLWLGAVSYSLYLIHRNIGFATLDWLHERGLTAVTAIGITTAVVLSLATVFTYLVERPGLRFLRGLYRRRPTTQLPRKRIGSRAS